MIRENERTCPKCGGDLWHYDRVRRVVREGNGKHRWVYINRYRCAKCRMLHRELPDYIYPFRQYSLDVIEGVLEGFITPETYGFDDYPCELTMMRWIGKIKFKLMTESR